MVLKTAWKLGLIASEDYHRACDLEAVRGDRLPKGRSLSTGELRALSSTCEHASPLRARAGALLVLLYGCGLRRAEAVALDLADWEREASQLRVRGKGDREHRPYQRCNRCAGSMAPRAGGRAGAIADLHRARSPGVTPHEHPGGLFRGQAQSQTRIRDLSPHDLRRTFVGDLLEAGADLSQVQGLAGHSQVTTTQRYDRRPEQSRKKAAQKLWVPYRPGL